MIKERLKQGSWTLLCHPAQQSLLAEIENIGQLITQFQQFPVTLKDNHRSLVKRGSLCGLDVVVKRPVDKNRRLWARLSSIVTAGEARATINNLVKLEQVKISSVKPLFALERRVAGLVVDSWICYEFKEGTRCNVSDMNRIIPFLQNMHARGFRHGDPTWSNFLTGQDGALFTIDTKAKPCKGAYHATVDFELLRRENKLKGVNIAELAQLNKRKFGYWLAVVYMSLKAGRSVLKNKLKKNRPKNT